MFNMHGHRSSSSWFGRVFLITYLSLLGGVLQIIALDSVAHASTDPQVFIAVDVTLPTCTYTSTRSAVNPASRVPASITRTHCLPGTVIETATIPLSQARMRHEGYVMALPPHASVEQQRQWNDQIYQLMQAKRHALQPHKTRPSSCGDAGQVVHVNSGYEVIFGDYINMGVVYYVSRDCSTITLDTVDVATGYVPYNNPVWWIQFAYSYYRDTCNRIFFKLYPNNDYSYNPDVTEPRNLTAVYTFQQTTVPGCAGGGGPTKSVDIGYLY